MRFLYDEIKTLELFLEDAFGDDVSETTINDFLWFETDTIAEWLGFDDWDDLVEKHKEDE